MGILILGGIIMGISGISFLVEMDRSLKDIPLGKMEPLEIEFEEIEGKSNTIYFSSFDVSCDKEGRLFIVEAHDPTDIDDIPIKDYPSVSDFNNSIIKALRIRCGDEEHEVFPIKVANLTLYQNGYRSDMPEEVCKKLTDALAVTKSNKQSISPEDFLTCIEIHSEKTWFPISILEDLVDVGSWSLDEEEVKKFLDKDNEDYINDCLGSFDFGNYSYDLMCFDDGVGRLLEVDVYAPCNSQIEAKPFTFTATTINECRNSLPDAALSHIIEIKDSVTNIDEFKLAVTKELISKNTIYPAFINEYRFLRDYGISYYSQFEKYLHDVVRETCQKQDLSKDDIIDLAGFYFKPSKEARELVEIMANDGLSRDDVKAVFKKFNQLGEIKGEDNLSEIFQEAGIKELLKKNAAGKEKGLSR